MPASFNKFFAVRKSAAPVPDTALAAAYLSALVRFVSAHHSKTKVTLPTGVVDVDELELVLRALGLVQDSRRAS